jgi:hypothetical protein
MGACQAGDRLLLADEVLDLGVAELLRHLDETRPHLDAAEGVEGVLGERHPAGEALRRDRQVARVLAVVLRVLRVVRVEEVGLVEEVDPVVQA